jgi:hypothetical protein
MPYAAQGVKGPDDDDDDDDDVAKKGKLQGEILPYVTNNFE